MSPLTVVPDANRVVEIMSAVAARDILPRFRRLASHDIAEKNPGDLVTTADIEAEKSLARDLTALQPGSVVVGEEAADGDPTIFEALGGEAAVWLVDPVDGTRNFVEGDRRFAVIVAWCVLDEVRAGWIHAPVDGITAWAVAGKGAWMRDGRGHPQRLRVASPAAVDKMSGSAGGGVRKRMAVRRAAGGEVPQRVERIGCVGHEYLDLARGRLHFARYGGRLKPWDHAAGVLIHHEAGGFGALMEDRAPYVATTGIVPATLLLAPDEDCWNALHRMMNAL